ncbi:hypothetical protein CJ195_16055 [Bacillus sp. UMB0899]|nr:hypothetical protein CJ195_16055 [Bacillus sp. UMB0899]
MKIYQIMSDKWAVGVKVKDCIKPELVETLAKKHYAEVLKSKGSFSLLNERFISYFNSQLGRDSASYANPLEGSIHVIVL